MGLDIGLCQSGFNLIGTVEKDKWCRKTIALNHSENLLLGEDVAQLEKRTVDGVLDGQSLTLIAGGPPCQSFSTGGKRIGLSDPRGNMIFEYFRIIRENRPEYFIFENVANLITAPIKHRPIAERPGKNWNLRSYSTKNDQAHSTFPPLEKEELSGSAIRYLLDEIENLNYSIKLGILDASEHGAAQKRLRFIMIGCRDFEAPDLPEITHGDRAGLRDVRTLRDVIYDLQTDPGAHSRYTEAMASYFNMVPEGGNWRSIPLAAQKAFLGKSFHAGGGKTGFLRRLSWDRPCPTLTTKANRKSTALCHPVATRPLSVKEFARIQGFPDNWKFSGAMNQQYKQIGNAVPVAIGRTLGEVIMDHKLKPDAQKFPAIPSDRPALESMIETASLKLRRAARNHRTSKTQLKMNF